MTARNAIQAAQMAKLGIIGPQDIVDGRRGFWAVLSPGGHTVGALFNDFGNFFFTVWTRLIMTYVLEKPEIFSFVRRSEE